MQNEPGDSATLFVDLWFVLGLRLRLPSTAGGDLKFFNISRHIESLDLCMKY